MDGPGTSPYERLGVPVDASDDDIRRAFRLRAKAEHPDAGGDPEAFRLLREAYETLCDPLRRRDWDELHHVRDGWAGRHGGDEPDGWEGRHGGFTGDVEFPAWLRPLTDAPWEEAHPPRHGSGEAGAAPLPAEVRWWWPHHALHRPVSAGSLLLLGDADALVALDVHTGGEAWRAGLARAAAGPPVVVGDTVVVWTLDGDLHGLELGRGITRWQRHVGPPGPAPAALAVLDDTVVAARAEGKLEALDPTDGRHRWTARLGGPPAGVVGVPGSGVVVAAAGANVEAVGLHKGHHRWRVRSRLPLDLPPVTAAGAVWVPGVAGELHRLSIDTGAATGGWRLGDATGGICGAGDRVLVTTAGPSHLAALGRGPKVEWSIPLGAVAPEPAVTEGLAYLAEPDGFLRLFDVASGAVRGCVSLPFEPHASPVLTPEGIVLRERTGRMWALRRPH